MNDSAVEKLSKTIEKVNKKIDKMFKYYYKRDKQFQLYMLWEHGASLKQIKDITGYSYSSYQLKSKLKKFKELGLLERDVE